VVYNAKAIVSLVKTLTIVYDYDTKKFPL
jgi:hypothetical protein